ncbi:MAG: hypothetical protein KDA74_16215 [Planctomycetaceae bacterium]|nr:hypothetical protein [Planctomycetaceae bacterium]
MPDCAQSSEEDFNRSNPTRQKMSISRFVILMLIVVVALYSLAVLTTFIRTGTREAHNATQREKIKQNLKQIGIALQNYHAQEAEQKRHIQINEPLQEQVAPRSD